MKVVGPFSCAPSMGTSLEVQVLPFPDHRERSEAQLREGDRTWGGSVERTCGPTYRKRIRGEAERGEQARGCKSR
jgi:hypothetical protein